MIIASCRKEIGNADYSAPKSQLDTFDITIENGVAVASKGSVSLKNRCANKTVLILVHGFNSEWEDVTESYGDIEMGISENIRGQVYNEIVGFVWPGGDSVRDYDAADSRTKVVAKRLFQVVQTLLQTGATVDILGHSMGCKIILKMLKHSLRFGQEFSGVRNVLLTAPAVNDECLEKGEKYYDASGQAERLVVFYSKHDWKTLCVAFQIGDNNETGCALGYRGPEDINQCKSHVQKVNCKRVVGGHNKYKDAPDFFRHISKIIKRMKINRSVSL